MHQSVNVYVDPEVSRAKFAREIDSFNKLKDLHSRRGCWLVEAEFPRAFVVFATSKTQPPCVVFGAWFDFTNYDFMPPSVRLANPFTRDPWKEREVPTPPKPFLRAITVPVSPEQLAQGQQETQQIQPLLQSYGSDELPFLCLQGVREYHQHPLHSNDPWLARRHNGEGTLHFLVEQLWKYGVEPLSNFQINFQVGFGQAGIPQ